MVVMSNKGWRDKTDSEIFDSLGDWVMKCDLKYSKSDALYKVKLAQCLWGEGEYIEALHLLDENEVFLKNLIGLTML